MTFRVVLIKSEGLLKICWVKSKFQIKTVVVYVWKHTSGSEGGEFFSICQVTGSVWTVSWLGPKCPNRKFCFDAQTIGSLYWQNLQAFSRFHKKFWHLTSTLVAFGVEKNDTKKCQPVRFPPSLSILACQFRTSTWEGVGFYTWSEKNYQAVGSQLTGQGRGGK